MHSAARAGVLLLALTGTASAQTFERFTVDSAISASQFAGGSAGDRPDIVVDITATSRLGKGWIAYVRPWFRRPSTGSSDVAREIYQAALQHERAGRVATRVDAGYILSPIGLGMMEMRPDTNPVIMAHLAYLVPMPGFDPGAPAVWPIASSYPFGGQVTASTTTWDVRGAVLSSPPNRAFVLNSSSPNPSWRPFAVIGGGVTPRTGLRLGIAYGTGDYATRDELPASAPAGRHLNMMSVEGEFAFRYSRITGEITRDSLATASGHATATEWFVEGVQTLTPRWFAAFRYEGANAPPRQSDGVRPTLRTSEIAGGFRLSPAFTVRASVLTRKTYFAPASERQAGASLVWAQRWR